MNSSSDIWQESSLDPDDAKLVDAYEEVGISLDALPYTDDFRQLARIAKANIDNEDELRHIYQRLLSLRKKGRLPRVYNASR